MSADLKAKQVNASYCGLKINIFSFHTSLSGAIDRIAFVRTIYFHLPPPLLSTTIIIHPLFLCCLHSSLTIPAFSSLGNRVFQAVSRLFSQRAGGYRRVVVWVHLQWWQSTLVILLMNICHWLDVTQTDYNQQLEYRRAYKSVCVLSFLKFSFSSSLNCFLEKGFRIDL